MTSSTHWNILSSWSKAGIGTSIVLELKKPSGPSTSSSDAYQPFSKKSSPRIAFDIGATPCFDDAIPAKYVFISHGHVDHIGALFSHARAHAVTFGGAAPTYFIPAQLLPQIKQCHDAMSNLDASNIMMHSSEDFKCTSSGRNESLIQMKLIPVNSGEEILLNGISYGSKTSFFMRAFEVDHAGHPALGYIIGSRTTAGLKKEYQNLSAIEIRELAKSGVSIKSNPIEKIEVAYTGDTCAEGLMKKSTITDCDSLLMSKQDEGQSTVQKNPSFDIGQMFQAELLLCELTFLDSSEGEELRTKARQRGHLHINDLDRIFSGHNQLKEENQSSTTNTGHREADSISTTNQYPNSIVFYHLSAKYQPATRALEFISEGLPHELCDRCHVAISSMMTQEEKTSDDDNSIAKLIQPNGCISIADYRSMKDVSI